jgi:lipid-A-disaccharide synthase
VSRAARAVEFAAGVAASLLAVVPFLLSLVRSVFTARSERRRVAAALARRDPAPGPPPPPGPPRGGRLLVSAGEPSGDRIAAGAVEALLRRHPGVAVRGFGGRHLAAAGARLDADLASDPVMGFLAVLRRAPRFLGLFLDWTRLLDEERPDAVLLVDYPGFNVRAAQAARRRGIPVIWYVVPQIWAWAPWRARRIGRAATDLCVVLPFERAFYEDRGIAALHVGYPLFEDRDREPVDAAVAERLRAGGRPVLALLPGSRRQEIEGNLAPMLRALALLRGRMPEARAVVACAGPGLRERIDAAVRASGQEVEVLDGHARTLLSAARAALCVSGTVTMECVHAGVPSVIVYRVSPFGRAMMPVLLTVERFGLPNLLAGRDVFPEHADPAAETAAIAAELEERMREGPARTAALEALADLRARMAVTGVAERVAAVIEARLPPGPAAGDGSSSPGTHRP